MRPQTLSAAILLLAGLSGCRSIKSTYVGNPEKGEEVGGLPIVVRSDRWLKVSTVNTAYDVYRKEETAETLRKSDTRTTKGDAEKSEEIAPPKNVGDAAKTSAEGGAQESVSESAKTVWVKDKDRVVETTIVVDTLKIDEVYALDLERPAAGSIDYGVTFEKGSQYPGEVKGKVEDRTLQDVTAAAKALLEAKTAAPTAGDAADGDVRRVKVSESVVRVDFYDLRATQPFARSVLTLGEMK